MVKIKIGFMGTPLFAVEALKAILNNSIYEVVVVYTKAPKPKGRSSVLQFSDVHQYALDNNLKVLTPASFKFLEVQEEFAKYNLDLVVVASYGLILPKKVLSSPKFGCINIHASILPKLRGASPIHHAILSEEKTGITIMQMDEGMDSGDILLTQEVDITNSTTFTSLYNDLTKIGASLVLKAMDLIFKGQIKPIKQDNTIASYAKILNKNDGKIDWAKFATHIEKQIRAFEVFPGSYFFYKEDLIKVIKATVIKTNDFKEYKVGTIVNNNSLQIMCGDGNLLQIDVLQKQGKKPLTYGEFKKGNVFDLFYCIV